jgi:starvation-inducible DNA-binding protein
MEMYQTTIDLSADVRKASSVLLNARLADAIDLAAKLKHAHWNVHGPHFMALHLLFDDLHEEVESQADLIAERVVTFGETAIGTLPQVTSATSLADYPQVTKSKRAHLDALAEAIATYGTNVRAAISTASVAGDIGTADLFTHISRIADQQLWKIEAHFRPAH